VFSLAKELDIIGLGKKQENIEEKKCNF